ncbi:MAG: HU family DNA-binding protein [Clostridia bacterium]|nr:HU family DNA-binding protein [Clostridia bacterium]
MNKTELIEAIVKKTDLKKKDAEAALGALIESIEGALKKGDKVQLVGFGTFETKKRKAREGRNPRTGETIKIAACKYPAFSAGKALKDAVNKKK